MHAAQRPPSIGLPARATMAVPKPTRSNSAGSTVLVNLDIYLVRATIGRDISPEDDDLLVLFRRNSKEVHSEPTRWHADHVADWNQHVGIQTSLLRAKHHDASDYLAKEYEVVLVALPSHSAVALFTVDFASVVHAQPPHRPKLFRISPTKCRDLAATLEFEVVWEYAAPPPPTTPPASSSSITSSSLAGRRTNVSVVSMSSQNSELPVGDAACADCRSTRRRLERKELQITQLENFLKESQKRIDSLVFENEELLVREEAETKNASQYRALTMRLLQELEMAFQFCVQQMLDAQAKSDHDGGAPPALFMFLPQFEFMERVKKFHAELERLYGGSAVDALHDSAAGPAKTPTADAWRAFDVRAEMDAALERNQRLQHQLAFLQRSLALDGHGHGSGPGTEDEDEDHDDEEDVLSSMKARFRRQQELEEDTALLKETPLGASRVATVRSVTEQLNALERENFVLKAKLESARNELKRPPPSETATTTSSTGSPRSISASLAQLPVVPDDAELRLQVDQLGEAKRALETQVAQLQQQLQQQQPKEDFATSGGSDFLNKIYQDVGRAKLALEEKVEQLTQQLSDAHAENARLVELQEMEPPKIEELPDDEEEEDDAREQLQQALDDKTRRLEMLTQELEFVQQHLKEKAAEVTNLEAAQSAHASSLDAATQALAKAQKRVTALEIQLEALQHDLQQQQKQQQQQQRVAKPAASDDDVAELTKQLKLARQEVMQLRYRSNNLESVHEKLEESLKEKKTLQVKLTALEGQLFEQRSRTISDFDKDTTRVDDLQARLDAKTQQLARERKDTGDLEAKVARFADDLAALTRRNEQQAAQIEALGDRIGRAAQDKQALEAVLAQMVAEMEALERGAGTGDDAKPPVVPRRGSSPIVRAPAPPQPPTTPGSSSTPSPLPSPVPKNTVAHLIKNFSGDADAGEAKARRGTFGSSFKKITKIDFRQRQPSA